MQGSAWSNHVDGVVALAKLRGAEGWQTEESINIFRAIRMCMVRIISHRLFILVANCNSSQARYNGAKPSMTSLVLKAGFATTASSKILQIASL
jgi:hypothetical protein